MEIIGIVGAGTMGADIACLAAVSGYTILLYDANTNKLKTAHSTICDQIKEQYNDDEKVAKNVLGNINQVKQIKDIEKADIVLECAPEEEDIKKDIFIQLDRLCKPGAILATNTSSISITTIAAVTKRPESVLGIHFLNPAKLVQLVELVAGLVTTRETIETAKDFIKKLGKGYVESKDFPGFFLDRMLIPMINEAITLLYEGAGTVEMIDKVMTKGLNLQQGPLAYADTMGLDTLLSIAEQMYKGYSDPKYRPCPLLKQYVAAGYLGKKSGRGFYIYS